MPEKVRKILMGILAAVFVVSTALLVRAELDKTAGEDIYREAEQLAQRIDTQPETLPVQEAPTVPPTEPTEPTAPAEPVKIWVPMEVEGDPNMEELAEIDLAALREVNEDVIGWIFLPNTKIRYPIVQGEDNEFYLEHAWDGRSNYLGSIYLEKTNSRDLKDFHSLLYGHNMRDESMFGALRRFESQSFWEKNPYLYLVTDEGILRYEIYSTYKTEVGSDAYLVGMLEGKSAERFLRFSCEQAQYDTGIVPNATDRILTLSTCVGNYDYRRVVHARLVMTEVEQ